ncbi:hypothetical protein [Winogradskyella sp. 3972H.M.0a.05]|uniref:hypothetical protein n=1 Tax=Winogradskyella sp. 3972H.M.0a.05 TaxID=2950277 RepID=UPI0033969901
MIKKYSLSLLAFLCAIISGFAQTPWINEIHYDNNGSDVNEGVEIAVPTTYSCATNDLRVVFYNGSTGTTYGSASVPTTGGATVNNVRFIWIAQSGIQNGAPDGIALVCGSTVIQFLSYEGTFAATNGAANGLNSTDIGVNENNSTGTTESIQLQGSGCDYSDFTWVQNQSSTHDNINTGQTINCGGCSITDISISNPPGSCNDNGTASDASDDYYIADVTITYSNPPASGSIDLTGAGVVGGTTSATVGTSPQTITGVQLAANGSDVEVTATFSADGSCTYTETVSGSGVASCSSSGSSVCLSDDFNSGYGNWTGSGTYQNGTAGLTGNGTGFNSTGDEIITTNVVSNPQQIEFQLARSASTANKTFSVQYSTNNTGPWTTAQDILVGSVTTSHQLFTVPLSLTGDYYIRLVMSQRSGGSYYLDDVEVTCGLCTTPTNATSFNAVESCGSIDISWIAPSCAEEVLIVARETNAVSATPTGDGSAYTADAIFGNGTDLATNEYAVYKSNGTSANITGLTNGSTYHFTIFSRTGTSWSTGVSTSVAYSGVIDNPTAFTSVNSCGDALLQWTLPSCYDEVLVVARASNPVSATPTGDSTTYTANSTFGSGDALAAGEFAVYRGTGTSATITGLTDGTTYHFTIFNEAGNTWSSGSTTSVTVIASSSSSPTIFSPGDLVFVGFDSYITDGNDRFSILTLVDIGLNTEFTIANLLYEYNAPANTSTDRWYDCSTDFDQSGEPPYATLQYNGCADIPKGSVICVETETFPSTIQSITVNGIDVTSDFTILNNPSHANDNLPGNISTSSPDTMWLMQGTFSDVMTEPDGPDTGDTDPDNYRTFTGTVLGGVQTKGSFQAFSVAGNAGGDRISRIHPDIECTRLEIGNSSTSRFYAYHDVAGTGISTGTQSQLLANITDNSNWLLVSANSGQASDDIAATCNSSYTVNGTGTTAGLWTGTVSDDWFNCSNWDNFAVPDALTDVTIDATAARDCVIDNDSALSSNFGNEADCNDITISGRTLVIEESDDVLNVNGNLVINVSGSLDMDDGNNGTDDGQIFLTGNWTNLLGEAVFEEGNSTVTFEGTVAQLITYNTPPPIPPVVYDTEIFHNVVLDNDFDTNTSNNLYANGDLTINAGRTLDVRDGDYVHVDDVVTTNATATFYIHNNGSLIQVNDAVTNVGNLSMERSVMMRRQDYVYWSSPINGFNIDNVSPGSPTYHIYRWVPTAPNTGTSNGQGNWVTANGETMGAGVGYIVRGDSSFNNTTPTQLDAVFQNGVPRTGTTTVTVSRGTDNDGLNGNDDDDDWNLVGNPYPSAISALDFLNANTNLDGFVNIWTHGALPSNAIPDPFYENNNGFNYDPDDYITHNGTGTTSGPAGFNGYIAAGQSFMVNLDDGPATTTSITFNNSMRSRTYDNSNFYRLSSESSRTTDANERHRIWLDLASENNGVDRILVGYVNNATMDRDRLYDAITSNKEGQQNFYSIINEKPFVIQGRALPFVDTDVIPLGFNSIAQENYTIAISAVDGIFESDQNIYLKDNLLGFVHNLTESPYTFTAESGAFNDRFEIVFQGDALSIVENELDPSGLIITELPNGNVEFTVPSQFTIEAVEIIDLLGRTIYRLNGNSHTLIHRLDNLSKAAYIAKVRLSDGQVITKKAIKQK